MEPSFLFTLGLVEYTVNNAIYSKISATMVDVEE